MADSDLFLLSIAYGASARNSLHGTRKEAEDALFAYVGGNWAEDMNDAMPKGRAAAIALYFDPDYGIGESESYIIEKLPAPSAKVIAAARRKA